VSGADLKAWRDARGWTQERLAEALSCDGVPPVSPNTVARWERDERRPPPYLRLALERLAAE
jgi:transcriptional regulator with XRE-family HTH domain